MTANDTMVKIILDRWEASIKNFDTALNAISDEQLVQEIAPGRNRGIYILGHLIAVHDIMFPLLEFGPKEYPELFNFFIETPDKTITDIPSATELRAYWSRQCQLFTQKISAMEPDEWFKRHTSVSAEDFINEPHRNKLNIILTRTTHLAYHTGQFILLLNKSN